MTKRPKRKKNNFMRTRITCSKYYEALQISGHTQKKIIIQLLLSYTNFPKLARLPLIHYFIKLYFHIYLRNYSRTTVIEELIQYFNNHQEALLVHLHIITLQDFYTQLIAYLMIQPPIPVNTMKLPLLNFKPHYRLGNLIFLISCLLL